MVSACHNKCIQVPQLPWRWVIATVSCAWETQFVIPTSWADVDGYRMSMESGWLIRPAEYPHGCRWGVREQSTCRSHWPLQDQTSITTAASSAYDYYLVGGFNPSEKYKSVDVSWDYYSQYMENKICSKPPTSYHSNVHSYRYYTVRRVLPRHEHWGCLAIEHMIGEIAENMAYTQCFLV